MGAIRDKANVVYADGPSSAPSQPPKQGARELAGLIEDLITGAAEGLVRATTLAGLGSGTRVGQPGQVTDGADKGEYYWSGSAWVRTGDLIDPPAIQASIVPPQQAYDALSGAQMVGTPAMPITGTALAGSTYVLNAPVAKAGYITSISGYALSAGSVRLKRFLLSAGTFTQTGTDIVVAVPAGAFTVSLKDKGYIAVNAGDYLGFWAAAPSIIPVNAGAQPSDSRTPYYASATVGNVTSVTAGTLVTSARIELAFAVSSVSVTASMVQTIGLDTQYALSGMRAALLDAGIYSPALALLEHYGAWYDLTDRTSLFTDLAGTVPVSETGDLVRCIRDKSGNGYDFAVTDDAYRPSYKRKAMGRYSTGLFGSTHHLKAKKTGLTRNRDKVTVFVLAKWTAPSGGQSIIVHSILDSATTSRLYVGQVGIPSASRLGAIVRPTDPGSSINVLSYKYLNLNYFAGEWVILECEMDWAAGTAHVFTNGYNTVEGAITFTPAAASRNEAEAAIWLGGMGPTTNPFIGEMAEVIELCGTLAPETREGIYDYLSRKALDLALGDLEDYDPTGPLPAIFFWFNDPHVIQYDTGKFIVGGNSSGGSPIAAMYDFTGTELAIIQKVIYDRLDVDDHDVMAIARLPDGNIIVVVCRHTLDPHMWVSKTTTPGDISSFGAAIDIGTAINPVPGHDMDYAYNFLYRLSGESDRLYLVFRASDNDDYSPGWRSEDWCITWSDDGGTTWVQAKKLWGTRRPYTKVGSNGTDRLDFFFNNSHPGAEWADHNNVYHCYYTGGSFYKTDGTLIGDMSAIPFDFSQVSLVYDQVAEGLGRSWVWDIVSDPVTHNPVGCFAVFTTDSFKDHRYHQARWSGSAWTHHQICTAGGPLIPSQAAYSGGVITDPENIDVVYCSRQVDASGNIDNVNGIYQLFKYVTADGGVTWTGTQLTFGDYPSFRPVIPKGARKLFYVTGPYGPTYAYYQTKVAVMDID